jgi:hypothetical protein
MVTVQLRDWAQWAEKEARQARKEAAAWNGDDFFG